jgi:peptidoglycan hydrolase-like protein with peptidoglycan-binding domain
MDIKKIVSSALPIIFANEGNYGSINLNDNGALSVGKVQWHGNRALSLLKKIVNANKVDAQKALGEKLYDEVKTTTDWQRRIAAPDEAKKISILLNTYHGKLVQDVQAENDISAYIMNGIKLGITDEKTLIYYADVENQGGAGASNRIGKAAIARTGQAKKVSLDIYHACALADRIMSQYASRRNNVYNKCRILGERANNPYNESDETIFKGCKGEGVKWVQWELINDGITTVVINGEKKKLTIDGECGPITDIAIRIYQDKHMLYVDGKAGPDTKASFKAA